MPSNMDENTQNASRHQTPPPVFILSPAPRSGTNYLANILLLHPDFQLPNLIWEDHVLIYSHLLTKYTIQTSNRWSEAEGQGDYAKDLLNHLGEGILSFLYKHVEDNRRLLCKTPRGYNIDNFFRLFPNAKLLILIRDGRDVITSAVKTWPNRFLAFERSAFTWARGARQILEFIHGSDCGVTESSWKLIKFECLIEHPEATVKDLLNFLNIDANTFDINQVQNLRLEGSSVYRGDKDRVHWEPVEKPKDFQPVGRWKSWNWLRKMTFKMIAGQELIRLGYVDNNHW
jgi:hypothetical protein